MSEYNKTLKELWEENGCKPVVCENDTGLIFEMVGLATSGFCKAVGLAIYTDGKRSSHWDDTCAYWKKHTPKPKLIKWYRPRIVWWQGRDQPADEFGEFFKDKNLNNWFRVEHLPCLKIVEWEEIEAPETWEECE